MRHAIFGIALVAVISLGMAGHSVGGTSVPMLRAAAAPDMQAEGEKAEDGAVGWASLDDGLREVRKSRKPALIVYDGSETLDPSFRVTLETSALKRLRRQFVSVRLVRSDLAKPYPRLASKDGAPKEGEPKEGWPAEPAGARAGTSPTVAERFKLLDDESSLVVLSFREDVIGRFDREVPTPFRLSKALSPIYKVHSIHVAGAQKVDRAIQSSRYAVGVGKQRDAVRMLLPLLEEREQRWLDEVSRQQLEAIVSEYKAKANREMDAADRLEADKKFQEALRAFDSVVADYPFKDIQQRANKRKGEILRKMTYGY